MNNVAIATSPSQQVHDLHSERWLRIRQEKVTDRDIIVQGIEFHLNANQFAHLKTAQEQRSFLDLSPQIVREIRYYTLFNPVLTFSTFYQKELVFRSTIALDGEVLNQVRADCLERPEFAAAIASVHHWLIQEAIAQVPIQYKRLGTKLAWILAVIIVALSVILSLANFQVLNPVFWLLPLVAVWLFAEGIKRLIWLFLPLFQRWLLRQMLAGRFSKDSKSRRFVLDLLAK